MTEQAQQNPAMALEELVVAHSYEMMALITVLEKKGLLTRTEIMAEIQALRQR